MRLIWKTLGYLAVLIAVAGVSLYFLPAERWGRIASDQLTKQLGRQVTLSDVRFSIWPVLGVQAGGLKIANADWAGDEPMVEAQSAAFGLDPTAALRGSLVFHSISATAPTLRLTTRDGRNNWDLGGTPSGDTGTGGSPAFALTTLDNLSITDGELILDSDGAITRLTDTDLSLRWPDTNGPLDFDLTLRPAASTVSLDGTLLKPRALIAGGAAPVTLTVTTKGGTLAFDGLAGTAPEAQGKLTLNLSDTAQTAAAFGQLGLSVPQGLGQSVKGSLQLTLTRQGRLALRDTTLTLDGNAIALNADIDLGTKPRVNAQIQATALDLSALTGTDSTAPATTGWSTAAIDATGLSAFDGEISLVTDALTLAPLTFGKTRALMTLVDSRATFELRELQGYGGLVTGEFVANARGGLSTRADLAFAGLALRDLLTDTMGISRFSGPADGSLSLLASGNSVAALVSSLSGQGTLRAGPGVIEGIDLAAALTGQASGGTTIFDQATGTFTANKGVLKNDDLAMTLPLLLARGTGRIDLGQRSLDYLLTVLAPQARDGRGASIPVRVKGPWSSPRINVDAAEVLNQNFADEKAQIEQKARDTVNEALQDKLGVTVEQGQSVEDALREKLEESAADSLLNLLKR